MRRFALPVLLLTAIAVSLVGGMLIMLALAKPTSASPPDYEAVSVGGLDYQLDLGRLIDPATPVDAAIVRGLPASERRVPPRQSLFGAFISITNSTGGRLPSARDIVLRDDAGNVYRPIPLPPGNPYAYRSQTVPPHTQVPAPFSQPSTDLAATGYLLLYRIPAEAFDDGVLELVVHDPANPARTASVLV